MRKRVLLAPIDPVHDVGLKMIARGLAEAGHETVLLQPDLPPGEIIQEALDRRADVLLLSRTLGYGVSELLAKFADMADASGLRDSAKVAVGGMAIRPELAQELGFDAGFGPGATVAEALAFVEGREFINVGRAAQKQRGDIIGGHTYQFRHSGIKALLDSITEMILAWAGGVTSPGIERAAAREELWDVAAWRACEKTAAFEKEYPRLCESAVRRFYENGEPHPKMRSFEQEEIIKLEAYIDGVNARMAAPNIRHTLDKPLIFNQYGTGCPFMDIAHIKVSEAWGADGAVHFDPSWGARTEGFFDGFLTHQEDGTVITPANLDRIRGALAESTLWQVRAHRGLNTPETVVLAGKIGAHLTKINMCYGSLGAGTDPARMTADGVAAIKYAAKYAMPFDVVTNEELCGVPAHKAFAGMLIVAALARALGASPILQPLFCYSPEVMIGRQMDDNYVDFNMAKVLALRSIVDAPIWPGAPVGFLTQSEDRVQSAASTAFHGGLAAMLGADAVSVASSDEAYSGGPISAPAKIDTLRSTAEAFRFFGHSKMEASADARAWGEKLVGGIESVLKQTAERGCFVEALYDGILGSRADGAYPGRAGRGTVARK